MKSKDKSLGGDKHSRGMHKPKGVAVAEGSMQTRAPGAVMRGGPASPFPMAHTGSQQSDTNGRSQRSVTGTVHQGWSARQRGERMQAQAEQDRLGEVQQSGSRQSDAGQVGAMGEQGRPDLPASDVGSKRNKKHPGS